MTLPLAPVAYQAALVNSLANAWALRDQDWIPGWGRFLGEGNGNPLQYSCLENPMDWGVWQATFHGVTKDRIQLRRLSTHAHTCRWHHPYLRKWKGTKEPLDEGERGEWKNWLKSQLNIQKTKIMASSPITSWQIDRGGGDNGNSDRLYFLGLQNHCRWWLQPWNYKMLTPWKKSYNQPRECIKKQKHYFANKGLSSQSYGFSSSHVWMWELDHKEGWALKNWCFWTVVLEKTLESPLDCKEIIPVNPKGKRKKR